ncbi:MAG TPA: hypothetical protein VL125_06335 [Pelobium sp.]|nr:hypothetical protein [Pelobium sp.]
MKEIKDKDFDKLFKERMAEGFPPFEEESWRKMEEKLDRKDRRNSFLLYRNASIILLFLSFGLGLFILNKKEFTKVAVNTAKISHEKNLNETPTPKERQAGSFKDSDVGLTHLDTALGNKKNETLISISRNPLTNKIEESKASILPFQVSHGQYITDTAVAASELPKIAESDNITNAANKTKDTLGIEESAKPSLKNIKKGNKRIPISVSFNLGPDFNSTNNLIGGKGNFAIGVSVGFGLFKRLSLETGLNYGSKNYTANNYDYTFGNPNVASKIAMIEAACKVLEIPLSASYQVFDLKKSSINLNLGLSSYLMLKEDYNFIYTAASGYNNRLVEKKNANQHYLSVIDLSATYNIKLKNKKFAFGIEPYLKIPMSGIGEGNVPLKSSGISLKLRYEKK